MSCSPDTTKGVATVGTGGLEAGGAPDKPTTDDLPPIVTPTNEEMLYQQPPPPDCGDGDKGDDEACDDGNRVDGDGCSANCLVVENGFKCDPGLPCERVAVCGDSLRIGAEQCDDGNTVGGDGCSANCQIENGYSCDEPGKPCVSNAVCGDGFIEFGETCDDGNTTAGDGCSATCQLEDGWVCGSAGTKCTAVCGDGLVLGGENCDDGNTDPGDGCGANCRLEPGFACGTPGSPSGPCHATVCQDGTKEGSEQCDDGNDQPYDGCTAACTNEPRCAYDSNQVYTCGAVCGDGMLFPGEDCDDGNTVAGDGCSPDCKIEDGFICTNAASDLTDPLVLPVLYHDFNSDHPQFEVDPGAGFLTQGMVFSQFGSNNKPVYNPAFNNFTAGNTVSGRAWTLDGRKPASSNAAAPLGSAQAIADAFAQWYVDVPGVNAPVVGTLNLALQNDGSFQFSAIGAANQFFPLDGLGLNQATTINVGNGNEVHNFHFTSEVRQWFLFEGGEQLTFTGDDDVWVFINGQLAVDLGGIHQQTTGSITLSADGTDSALTIQGLNPSTITVPVDPHGVNEIAVFQAERHVTASNYQLTLRGFSAPVSTCHSVCGDGIVTPDESCDDGADNGTGYGHCKSDCTPGPHCGDGIKNGDEVCDNGVNRDVYATSSIAADACAPGCVKPPFCGDGKIDASDGEQCDDGVNDGSYGGCTPDCLLGPRCGDGIKNGDEECDDGNRRNTDGCDALCHIERQPI